MPQIPPPSWRRRNPRGPPLEVPPLGRFCLRCPLVVPRLFVPTNPSIDGERLQVKCSHCGKTTDGIELTPGAVSAICEKCNDARTAPLVKPTTPHIAKPGKAAKKRKSA